MGNWKIQKPTRRRVVVLYERHARCGFFFYHTLVRERLGRKVNAITAWAFRNTKKAGRSEERVREKVGSLVGQRRCCSFPSSGLRHPCAPRPPSPATRVRTPTLVRSLAGIREDMSCVRTCAYNAYTHLPGLHVRNTYIRYVACVCVIHRAHLTTHPSTHLGN